MVRDLTSEESRAFSRMLGTIRQKAARNQLRTTYAEAKMRIDKIGPSIPEELHDFATVLGWADKACRATAARIRPDGFTSAVTTTLLDDLTTLTVDNHLVKQERLAVRSSMRHSASFMFVSSGEEGSGEPDVIVAPRTALEATAVRDRRSGRVTEALEMVSKNEAVLYVPGRAVTITRNKGQRWSVAGESTLVGDLVPCVPYVWGETLERPFGTSRITRPLMTMIDNGIRTFLRQEANAEYYSAPRMAAKNARKEHFEGPDGNPIRPWSKQIGSIWALPYFFNEETGEVDEVALEQFQQASMQPHSDQLRTIAMAVAGETSMPASALGIIHDNPSSADAMRASENELVTLVEDELPAYGTARWDLGRNMLACLHGEWTPAMEKEMRGVKAHFLNPATATASAQADAGQKFASTYPQFADSDSVLTKWGFRDSEIAEMRSHAKRAQSPGLLDKILAGRDGAATLDSGGGALEDAQTMKAKFEGLGIAIRAGVEPDVAAERLGLTGVKFIPGRPITIRQDGE